MKRTIVIPEMPSDAQIRQWLEEGLTYPQMRDRWMYASAAMALGRPAVDEDEAREHGHVVTTNAFSVRRQRMGLAPKQPRYTERIPWHVHNWHKDHYAARMLRLLARQDAGLPLTESKNPKTVAKTKQKFKSWMEWLPEPEPAHGEQPASPYGKVVDYWPSSKEGFKYVPATLEERQAGAVIRAPKPKDKKAA